MYLIKTIWFVNYTTLKNTGRTTEIYKCHTKKEAIEFSRGKYGFIIQQDKNGNTLDSFFGDFQPSAHQQRVIKDLLDYRG